jgi:hypothetical protein
MRPLPQARLVLGTSRALVGADDLNVMRYMFDRKEPEEVDIDVVHVAPRTRKVMATIVGAAAVFCAFFTIWLYTLTFLDKTLKSKGVLQILVVCAILVWADSFLFRLSLRMFRGQEDRTGFASPRTFRVASLVSLSIAVLVFVRSISSADGMGVVGSLIYFGLSIYLWKVAKLREKLSHNQSTDPTA